MTAPPTAPVMNMVQSALVTDGPSGGILASVDHLAEDDPELDIALRSFWDLSVDMLVTANTRGFFTRVSPSWSTTLGYTRDELVSVPYLSFVHPDDVERTLEEAQGLTEPGVALVNFENRYRAKDGQYHWLAWSCRTSEDGESIQAVVRDVTQAHKTAELQTRLLSEQRASEQAVRDAHSELAQRQSFMESVINGVDVGVVACDSLGRTVLRNETQCRIMGIGPEETLLSHEDAIDRVRVLRQDGADLAGHNSPLLRALRGTDEVGTRLEVLLDESTPVQLRVVARQICDDDGSVLGAVAAFTDVTEELSIQAQVKEGAAFHDAVLAATPDLIYVSDPRTHTHVWASRSLVDMLGYTEKEIQALGPKVAEVLIHPEDLPQAKRSIAAVQAIADGQVLEVRHRVIHADGTERWLARRLTPFARDEDGAVTQVLAVARDVTDIVEVEERLGQAALHDSLTGLPNRTLLADRLRAAVLRAARSGERFAVLMVDLDGFKAVNDTSGHAAGDSVLRVVAERISGVLRAEDTVARLGGDEFAIILETSTGSLRDNELSVEALAESAAQRVGKVVREPIHVGERTHVVTASIGISFAGAGAGSNSDVILRAADAAMYQAKTTGRDRVVVYDNELQSSVVERRLVEATLLTALDDCSSTGRGGPRLSVAYQGIFDLTTGRVASAEALTQLHDEDGRRMSTDVVISVAEETGLIADLGRRVLDIACRDLATWRAEFPHHQDLSVAVKISAQQASSTSLLAEVLSTLRATNIPPHLLTLELPETALRIAGASTMKAINSLHELGVLIAIDDFGTGYASMHHLTDIPVSSVRIDRTFTAAMSTDPRRASVVRALAGLARDLDIDCVIEGIETQDQLAALPPGVYGQGFHLGRPMTAAEFGESLSQPHHP